MIFIGLIVLLAALDLCIKNAIEEQEEGAFPKTLEWLGGRIVLYKNHNPGFSFGFLKNRPELVEMIPLGVASFVGGMLTCLLQKKGQLAHKMAFSLVLGGAISNLYDRLRRGYVVDYFSPQIGKLKKVVFNLGDLFIFLGAAIWALAEIGAAWKNRR